MPDNTGWTPSPEENKLGITDKSLINQHEASGIAEAELFIFSLDTEIEFSISLILKIHFIAFSMLYEWAGKWRTAHVTVGQLDPPLPSQILHQMYQFLDNLNFKIANSKTIDDHLDSLTYAHYEFVRIHPFNNGNGRTGRLLMNLVALKLGYQPLDLYHPKGDSRKIYIAAMRAGDKGDFKPLRLLISEEMTTF